MGVLGDDGAPSRLFVDTTGRNDWTMVATEPRNSRILPPTLAAMMRVRHNAVMNWFGDRYFWFGFFTREGRGAGGTVE